jgi:hypothetical protein
MAADPLGSHVRDELGLRPGRLARPRQAAVVSAVSFAVEAALPLVLIVLLPIGVRIPVTALGALALLALLGALVPGLVVPRSGGRRGELWPPARPLGAGGHGWPLCGQMSQRLRCTNGSPAHHRPRPQVRPA